ncbi:MAG: hypothetical protein AB2551_10955 [Candidatus Thiodiazotropha sp.]
MKNSKSKIVYVPTDAELLDPPKYRVQWMIARNVVMAAPEMSRRKLLDDMSIIFARNGDKVFRYRNGMPYVLPDIDEIFANDPDMRSLSHYLESDESDYNPRRISRKPERLRIFNLYIKLKHPRFIKHLEK